MNIILTDKTRKQKLMNTTTTTQANINVQTMRELLAESDSDNFDLADLHLLFLHGFKGYNHMSDEEVIDTYNTVFDD